MSPPKRPLRSNFAPGTPRWAVRRAQWKALGLTHADLEKPKVAVINTSSELSSCFSHLDGVAACVKEASRAAGALAFDAHRRAQRLHHERGAPGALHPAQPRPPGERHRGAGRCCLVGALLPRAATAQPVHRPDLALREVARFGFEEQETNPSLVPRNWFRDQDDPGGARRPGFPSWNEATLVYDAQAARQGVGAVPLPTRGGSTALLLGPGVVPVFPGTDYRVRASVRTRGLTHAAAAVSARFLDASGRPLAGTLVRSAAVRSEREWADLVVDIPGLSEQAAWLQLELLLLQPEQVGGGSGPFHVWQEDHTGLAMFDEVVVTQLPRVELDSPDPVNVFPAHLKPSLRAMVRDLPGESLTLVLTARDIDGVVVDRLEKSGLPTLMFLRIFSS